MSYHRDHQVKKWQTATVRCIRGIAVIVRSVRVTGSDSLDSVAQTKLKHSWGSNSYSCSQICVSNNSYSNSLSIPSLKQSLAIPISTAERPHWLMSEVRIDKQKCLHEHTWSPGRSDCKWLPANCPDVTRMYVYKKRWRITHYWLMSGKQIHVTASTR